VDSEALPFTKTSLTCLIDPPYSEEDATRYSVSRLVSAGKVMRQLLRVLSPGKWLLWLDEKFHRSTLTSGTCRGSLSSFAGRIGEPVFCRCSRRDRPAMIAQGSLLQHEFRLNRDDMYAK
jgi:hypothetical protein